MEIFNKNGKRERGIYHNSPARIGKPEFGIEVKVCLKRNGKIHGNALRLGKLVQGLAHGGKSNTFALKFGRDKHPDKVINALFKAIESNGARNCAVGKNGIHKHIFPVEP